MTADDDPGFTYRARKSGEVMLLHHGAPVTTLRGDVAERFLAAVAECDPARAQQLMARLTGNYKRGNERRAAEHPRTRAVVTSAGAARPRRRGRSPGGRK